MRVRGGATGAPDRRGPFDLLGKAARGSLWLLLACPACLSPATPQPPEPWPLPRPGTILERPLSGGEIHHYALHRSQTEELWLTIAQDGIDVTTSLLEADGKARLTVDSPSGPWGEEWLLVRAEASADTLEIRSSTPHHGPGRYRLRIASRFPAELEDHRLRAAKRAATEAGRLVHAGTRHTHRQALEPYREALASWQALGREAETARTLFDLAILHRWLDEPRTALALLRRAAAAWQGLDEPQGEAQALMEIASTARMLGDNEYVGEVYQQALQRWRQLGDLNGQARTLNYLGLVRAPTTPHVALASYEEALALFEQAGNVPEQGVTLNNIGGIHDLQGEPFLALERFHQALDIHQRLGDLRHEARVWNNIASVHRRTGRLQDALEGYRAALEIRRQLGDRRGQGRVLNNLGLTWLSLGDARRARDVLHRALALRRQSDDRRGESITLHNLGLVHGELQAWQEATDAWTEALALRRALRDRGGEAATLVAMGKAAVPLDRPAAARRYLQDALAILDEIGNPWRQAKAQRALGEALIADGEPEEALPMLQRSLQIFRATTDDIGEGETLLAVARAERALGRRRNASRLAVAYAHATTALDVLEEVRANVDSFGLRTSFLANHSDAFEFTVDLAMELHRQDPSAGWAAKALEIDERARARSLLDLLQASQAGPRRGIDAKLMERQHELLARLNVKVERWRRHLDRKGPAAESERLASETREVQARLDAVENDIRRQSPAWHALAQPSPRTADAIRALLDARTTLLQYALGEDRSFLWAITAERIESFELPGREEIETTARQVYEGLRIHDPRALRDDASAATRLSQILLDPVAHRLSDQRLAIVADGALHYLPFAALPHPAATAEPLLGRHEIISLASASALDVQRQVLAGRPLAQKTLAVVADPVFGAPDPRLPGSGAAAAPLTLASRDAAYRDARSGALRLERLGWSRWEAEKIATHVASDDQTLIALGFDAELDAVRGDRLRGYRVVHFATHGLVEVEHPQLSALVLSLYDRQGRPQQGLLRLPEIYNLDLDAELVVLSGCRTALGQEIRGEGLVGLTRGFLVAGARRLVASLWQVQDRSTAELMVRFYRRLLQDADDRQMHPAAALRAAQLELAKEPEFRDPYHWAAFTVYGDWR